MKCLRWWAARPFITGDVRVGAGGWETDEDAIQTRTQRLHDKPETCEECQQQCTTCIISTGVTVGKTLLPLQTAQIHRNTHCCSEPRRDDGNQYKNAWDFKVV